MREGSRVMHPIGFLITARLVLIVMMLYERIHCMVLCLFSLGIRHTRGCMKTVQTVLSIAVVSQASMKGSDKVLHPTDTVGCNYLSLSFILACDKTLFNHGLVVVDLTHVLSHLTGYWSHHVISTGNIFLHALVTYKQSIKVLNPEEIGVNDSYKKS